MKKINIAILLACFLINISCSSDDDNIEMTSKEITYSNNIKTIMDNNCMACHIDPPVNGAPMDLVTYQTVKESVENRNLIGRVENGSMPPGNNTLSAEEIQAIKDWKENGFKE